MARASTWLLAALVALPLAASAQPADVPALTKLIETQPGDLDRSTWKERRREAARKLATSKDKRAVPVLIKLAETETFDIIGEIAIEGLGNLGDPSAAPVLTKIANDNARDKAARDLAKKALAKLPAGGATTTTPPPPPVTPPPSTTVTPPPATEPDVDAGTTAGASTATRPSVAATRCSATRARRRGSRRDRRYPRTRSRRTIA